MGFGMVRLQQEVRKCKESGAQPTQSKRVATIFVPQAMEPIRYYGVRFLARFAAQNCNRGPMGK
jgi:hypothetical protein